MQRNAIAARGTVSAEIPGSMFQVQLDNGHRVVADTARAGAPPHLVPGDRVTVELSPPDLGRGHITMWTK
jgi:translation initiation factor IF-1